MENVGTCLWWKENVLVCALRLGVCVLTSLFTKENENESVVDPASRIGPAACSTARSATTCVASRRVAAAYGVAHLALRTPFYVQNLAAHGRVTTVDALRAWEHWSTGVVLFRSRGVLMKGGRGGFLNTAQGAARAARGGRSGEARRSAPTRARRTAA